MTSPLCCSKPMTVIREGSILIGPYRLVFKAEQNDGRWVANCMNLAGVPATAYGPTPEDAVDAALKLALEAFDGCP